MSYLPGVVQSPRSSPLGEGVLIRLERPPLPLLVDLDSKKGKSDLQNTQTYISHILPNLQNLLYETICNYTKGGIYKICFIKQRGGLHCSTNH